MTQWGEELQKALIKYLRNNKNTLNAPISSKVECKKHLAKKHKNQTPPAMFPVFICS